MQRRKFIKTVIALPAITAGCNSANRKKGDKNINSNFQRVRPGDPLWPSEKSWEQLKQSVDGNLLIPEHPFNVCKNESREDTCDQLFKSLKNPYYIGAHPGLTQTLGWHNAWTSAPSAYVVAARNSSHVVAAVNFARENNLRLVVKGGGHSYQGTSNSKDSLLIWTKAMTDIIIHESFIGKGCEGKLKVQPAVSVGAGAIWMQVYDIVTTKGGWYVQGGGCATVGVAGLIQSGGFGSLSKHFGLAASGLLEAEIVTADGSIVVANACTNEDLFWGLKGGGGGSLGVVTRITLQLQKLPTHAGVVFGKIEAKSDQDFQLLINHVIKLYKDHLFNFHWGEQIRFYPGNTISISMMFTDLKEQEVKTIWSSLVNSISENNDKYSWVMPFEVHELPPRSLWDSSFFKKNAPHLIGHDDRPEAADNNIFWIGDGEEAGQFLYGYHSIWLSQSLLTDNYRLSKAIYNASRYSPVSLHFNKGLAGADDAIRNAAKDTAMNPQVVDAFALAIIAGGTTSTIPGVAGHEPDIESAKKSADKIKSASDELLKIVPDAGSYVSESNFFQENWQQSFWGDNYEKLSRVKKKYDPDGLFFVHHGVGSEEWNEDGFVRLNK